MVLLLLNHIGTGDTDAVLIDTFITMDPKTDPTLLNAGGDDITLVLFPARRTNELFLCHHLTS